jgi:hypothetical protein
MSDGGRLPMMRRAFARATVVQPGLTALGRRQINEHLRRLTSTAHVPRDEDDDRVGKPHVIAIVLHDQGRAHLRSAPVAVGMVEDDDVAPLHGCFS